jgi:hypothetical protein
MKRIIASFVLLALTGCGAAHTTKALPAPAALDTPDASGAVIHAQLTVPIKMGSSQLSLMNLFIPRVYANVSIDESITTYLSASTAFSLDTSQFDVPLNPTPFEVNDFGFLRVAVLKDNNINVCGDNGHTHCGTALIRAYTLGTDGAGLWNSADHYGAPISAGQTQLLPVGLSILDSAILQDATISPAGHVVTLANFPNAKYDVQVDFSNAGTGTYSTTLVIEYVLAP